MVFRSLLTIPRRRRARARKEPSLPDGAASSDRVRALNRRRPSRAARFWLASQARVRKQARSDFYREAARFTPVVATDGPLGRCFVRVGDAAIGNDLFLHGRSTEREGLASAFRVLEKIGKVPRGKRTTFLDVGANIGLATLAALQEYGFDDGWAFEPEPANYRLLRVNLVANDLDSRVRTMPVAISDEEGEATLAVNEENFGDHRMAAHAARVGEEGYAGQSITVKTRTLDAVSLAEGLDLSEGGGLLWIDTQGHELRVLAGAKSLLDQGLPVVMEFAPWLLGKDLAPLEDLIESRFTHLADLGGKTDLGRTPVAASQIRTLGTHFDRPKFTDLLLYRE